MFEVGDEVVCVRMNAYPEMEGMTFHIAAAYKAGCIVESVFGGAPRLQVDAVQLVETGHHEPSIERWGFAAHRFRKVQRRDLTAWLNTEAKYEEPKRKKVKA